MRAISTSAITCIDRETIAWHLQAFDDIGQDEILYQAAVLKAACEYVQNATGHILIPGTYEQVFDLAQVNKYKSIPRLLIHAAPVLSIDKVQQINDSWEYEDIDTAYYKAITDAALGDPAQVLLIQDITVASDVLSFRVEFTAGYNADDNPAPEAVLQAVKMLARHWYDNRTDVITGTIVSKVDRAVDDLINMHIIKTL